MSEPDQREIIGYSIKDPQKKQGWIQLIADIEVWIKENDFADQILFHGTSRTRAKDICKSGLKPTDIKHSVAPHSTDAVGSFWGTVRTAAAYADDTCFYRNQRSQPCLLMVASEDLEEDCRLYPDLATLEMPLKGLTKLDDPDVSQRWMTAHDNDEWSEDNALSWRQSIQDLGAIIAVHDFDLPPSIIKPIETFDQFLELAERLTAAKMPSIAM